MEHGKAYMDIYDGIITGKAHSELDVFIAEEHSFEDFDVLLHKYSRFIDDVNLKSVKTVRVGMFEVGVAEYSCP